MSVQGGKRIFVSSTFLDNEARRKVVADAITAAGHVVVGMEHFTAAPRPPLAECRRIVEGCHCMVGILAHRYGWIPEGETRSITEIEYDTATAAGIPRLMFVLAEAEPVNLEEDLDQGPDRWEKQPKLRAFKAKISEELTPARFEEATLGTRVMQALQENAALLQRDNRELEFSPSKPLWSGQLRTGPELDPFPGRNGRPNDGRDRSELTVVGRREGSRVRWSYRTEHHSAPFVEREVPWNHALTDLAEVLKHGDGLTLERLGLELGAMLLGVAPEAEHHEICRTLFRGDRSDWTTPLAGSARVRLALCDELAALPWRLAALRDREGSAYWLTDQGWTFEHSHGERSRRVVSFPNPCSVVVVIPEHGPLREVGTYFIECARERLSTLWPNEDARLSQRLVVVHGHERLREELHRRPDIVIVLGRALSVPEPRLEFKTGVGDYGTSNFVPLSQLIEQLASEEIKLLYLATTNAIQVPAAARGRLACIVSPRLASSDRDTVETALFWLRTMLTEGFDPVRALHGVPSTGGTRRWVTMAATADFRDWNAAPAISASVDQLARRRIDRDEPRALFMRHVDELVKDERRRVEAFIVHGNAKDRLDWFGDQLVQECKDRGPSWQAYRQCIPFPSGRGSVEGIRDQLERVLADVLGLDEEVSARGTLRSIGQERGWPRRPFVYWLDWGACLEGISGEALEAWMGVVRDELPLLAKGSKNMRVVSTLAVVPSEPALFRQVTTDLVDRHQSDQCSITAFDPLGLVRAVHLERYLRDPRVTRCPEGLIRVAAKAVIRQTGGYFEDVIELVEQTERCRGWRDLIDAAAPVEPDRPYPPHRSL